MKKTKNRNTEKETNISAQKKIAVINDLSGYGRCSLTVALPVISALGLQCCPLPTAILSNHTGYPDFYFDDYTDRMPEYIACWKSLGFRFDGILTGFLGSAAQISIVERFICDFRGTPSAAGIPADGLTPAGTLPGNAAGGHAVVVIDPVMGDHGRVYSTLTPELCGRMKQLAALADVLTPNVTEACILTDTPYQAHFSRPELCRLLERLSLICRGRIVVTGADAGAYLYNIVWDPAVGEPLFLRKKRIAAERSGTGDLFSSIAAANVVKGLPLADSVRMAADFVSLCLLETERLRTPAADGAVFEPLLKKLMRA